LTEDKKTIPRNPESYIIADEEDDNLFFAMNVESDLEDDDAVAELALLVDVKGDGEEDSMEYIYAVYFERVDLIRLKQWINKAIKFMAHVEKHGVTLPFVVGLQDADGNVEEI